MLVIDIGKISRRKKKPLQKWRIVLQPVQNNEDEK